MIKKMLAVIGLSLVVVSTARADDPLDAAKRLYLAASYEEALASLATVPSEADPDQVDKLRALCLLALSRREEATKTLESLAARRPMLQLDDSESPKLVLLFREARLRMLPPATKSLYATAKGSYETGELEAAKQQFGDVLTLLAEPEMAKLPESADLKMLAEGFARLVDQQLARQSAPAPAAAARSTAPRPAAANTAAAPTDLAAARPATTPPAAAPRVAPPAAPSAPGSAPLTNSPATAATGAAAEPAAPSQTAPTQGTPAQVAPTQAASTQPAPVRTVPPQTPLQTPTQTTPTQPAPASAAPGQPAPAAVPSAAAPAEPMIFTEADQGVTAPVAVEQRLPPWVPPADLREQSFSGLVEVVINENGRVISAVIIKSVNATYDALLVNAAKRWQYRPALRNGRGVRFRRVVSIVLSPTS